MFGVVVMLFFLLHVCTVCIHVNLHISIVGVGVCAPVCVHMGLMPGVTFSLTCHLLYWDRISLTPLVSDLAGPGDPHFCLQAWRSQMCDTLAHYLLRMWNYKLWTPSLSIYLLSHLPNPSLSVSLLHKVTLHWYSPSPPFYTTARLLFSD